MTTTYNGWDGEFLFLSILEQSEDIVTDDDTFLPRENVFGTHIDNC